MNQYPSSAPGHRVPPDSGVKGDPGGLGPRERLSRFAYISLGLVNELDRVWEGTANFS